MILFPNAKINLGLNIIRKRPDRYHDLETVFFPINMQDALEVIQNDNTKNGVSISLSGSSINAKPEDNLCFKAFTLLKKEFPQMPAITAHLHKTIPAGGGLGGGSADGAFMLKLLNEKFALGLSTEQLLHYALQLGSDCPFFIINKPCFATGRGELLEPVSIDLSMYKLVVVNPGIHVSTSEVFSSIKPSLGSKSVNQVIHQPVETWKNELKNDFEDRVFESYPEIKTIKAKMYSSGAVYASMTGSGSTVYGMFSQETEFKNDFPAGYFVKELNSQL